MEPFPDRLLQPGDSSEADPETSALAKETLELAFIAAIQHLPPRQRATLIARDVLGLSTGETADMLEMTETAVKSALQRARATLGSRLGSSREEWDAPYALTEEERDVLDKYIDALDGDDVEAMASLLRNDVRVAYTQIPLWAEGRDTFIEASKELAPPGDFLFVATSANLQPAVAIYHRAPEGPMFRLTALEVLRVEAGQIADIVDYDLPDLYPAFGLPLEVES